MARKATKETLSSATPRKSKDASEDGDGKTMTVKDKIRIVALHLNGAGKKAIAGTTGFPMDWIERITDVFGNDREFVAAAKRLNEGKSVDDITISEGTGGAKRG